ncbi:MULTISPECIES: hypothetical protein [unclassified Paenibacillus]|uniref:Uncharacterized protein n=1 Tax=Paenibacillus provencensis TaxID=441151 RepID=A0ABW3QAX1_9BACL|nr:MULTISPECIES: hypothetical protein [unclassified Paenibacillus]MCM3130990.1 hypothetical protein [Paenibacillus sp. MER 78]SDX87966.1 hypothetical protein SAMN05518848_12228 [Paenibacillus sp. PDC88]SFS99184.1 hypothetical protein SAMN04488601_1153 [Paenibacillus sp. 453mf]
MNFKSLARLMGILPDNSTDSKIVAEHFEAVLINQMNLPFKYKEFSNLLSEVSDTNKRSMANFLNLKIRATTDRPFPDGQFIQLLRTRMNKKEVKSKVIQALVTQIIPLYEDMDELNVEGYLAEEKNLIESYGPWHYYWSLRFFPIEDDRIKERLIQLESDLPDPIRDEVDKSNLDSNLQGKKKPDESKESLIIVHERELRQKAEQVIAYITERAQNAREEPSAIN